MEDPAGMGPKTIPETHSGRALGNPMPVFPLSVKTGEGWEVFREWLTGVVREK